MAQGTLEVLLVGAKGLEETDILKNMDPYVILTYRSQDQKSTVASAVGLIADGESFCRERAEPEWNETFLFTVSESVTELKLKILDSDNGSEDDLVGEATIPLEPVFIEGSLPSTAYNVVKDEQYCGEIRVALTFTPEERRGLAGESFGGWKQSSADY